MGRIPRGRYAALIAVLCLAAAAGIVAVLVADADHGAAGQLANTAGGLLLFGLAAAAGVSITGGSPLAWIGWVCVLVAVAGFGLAMGVLWDAEPNEDVAKAAGSLFVFSVALAVVSLSLGRARAGDGVLINLWLVALASLATLATATLLAISIVADVDDELYYRLTAVVAVLAALGTALVPVVRAKRQAA
jgi:hypothetical protein